MIAWLKRKLYIKTDKERWEEVRHRFPCRLCGEPMHETYNEGYECNKKLLLVETLED